jgi:hypothetical protein
MNIALVIGGLFLLVIVYIDFAYTALSTSGSGFLSRWLSSALWKGLFWLSGKRGRSPLLNYSGMLSIGLLLGSWISLTWIGYSLLWWAVPDSLRNANTHQMASPAEKFYYVGYTLSTVGYGDFYAPTPFWKMFSVLIGFSGLVVVSLAITYLVQILSAEIEKKRLSLFIASLGETPQHLLRNAWNGKDFSSLNASFSNLSTLVLSHSQHHLAYPLLRYFHSNMPAESPALTLVSLDEALSILLWQVPTRYHPDALVLTSLHRALSNYLLTLEQDLLPAAQQPLPLPLIDQLQALMPMQPFPPLPQEQLLRRRRLLGAILKYGGWTWQDVNQPVNQSQGMSLFFTPTPSQEGS